MSVQRLIQSATITLIVLAGAGVPCQAVEPGFGITTSSVRSGSYLPEFAFDAKGDTRWASMPIAGKPEWLQIDFGRAVTFEDVTIRWERAYPAEYQIQVSDDGRTYKTLHEQPQCKGGVETVKGLGGKGRYVRINCTKPSSWKLASIWEIEFTGGDVGAAVADVKRRAEEARKAAEIEARRQLTESGTLWQIGQADNRAGELALGPGGYNGYERDGLLVVGHSDPREAWPYTHPGPDDPWGGWRAHEFLVLFALKSVAAEGTCRLTVDLLDTHYRAPPRLTFEVNGQRVARYQTPKGSSDDSIQGRPEADREHRFTVEFPAGLLHQGVNELSITNDLGSWAVYDSLALVAPAGTELGKVEGTSIRSLQALPWLMRRGGKPVQYVEIDLLHLDEPGTVVVEAQGAAPVAVAVEPGARSRVSLAVPPVESAAQTEVVVKQGPRVLDRRTVAQRPATPREPVDWVDCLIGASISRWMLYPGPSVPFGMVKLSPDNQGHDPGRAAWKGGYEYALNNIMGFSHVHSWTMGGLLVMPTTGPLLTDPGPERDPDAGYRSRFRHETEIAVPGYYAVTLDDYKVRAELTCTTRAGFQRYTFPKSEEARVLFDLLTPTEYGKSLLEGKVRQVSAQEIEGSARLRSRGKATYQDYVLHFVARTNKPFRSMGGWVNGEIQPQAAEIVGQGDLGVFLNFQTEEGEVVLVQTGISLVSTDQARLNLDVEMKRFGWDFDACHAAARGVWNELLSRIEVEGGRPVDNVKFYTNLYRSYCSRTIWSDVNGKYVDMNERVQQLADPDSPVYGCDAFWNTFWNLNQLWNLVTPDVSDKWVRSQLEIYDKGGWLAKGPTGIEYSSIMVASHEIPLIVAAYQHGIRGYNAEQAFEAMLHCQTTPAQSHPGGGHVGNHHLLPYLKHGYVPVGQGTASNTLEYAYDDWCVAQMAKALGHEKRYREFSRRGESWCNLFDAETGFMRARYADGRWLGSFNPYSGAGGWVEGNPWQFTWFVPQNVRGLVEAMGRERFIERLDEGLAKSAEYDFDASHARRAWVPINHGNQPSMQVAYLLNHAGAPWLTQKWARAIMENYYGDDPIDGWPGDEDQGQGGAWFVMSAMGLFQTDGGCRVDPIYEIGSPLFERIIVRLDPQYYPGKEFVIEARGNSPKNVYVQSATLDGRPLRGPWLPAKDLQDGGTLVLEMGPEPNKQWGADMTDAVPATPVPAIE